MFNSEFVTRRESLTGLLPTHEVDAILITAAPNVRYLSGFTGSNSAMLISREGQSILFTDPRYEIQAAQQTDCRVVVTRKPLTQEAAGAVKRLKIRKLGFELTRLSFESHDTLHSQLAGSSELKPVRSAVESLRMIKSDPELAAIRRSVETNSKAFDQALRKIKPGRTSEAGLAAEIEYLQRKLGAEGPSFESIVAAGDRSALPHATPGTRKLKPDDLLLIDMGATQDGYASDMTRVVNLGKRAAKAKRYYKAVLEAQLAAIDAVRAGVPVARVDRAARNVLKAHGLDKLFVHSTGHGLGLEIHEAPKIGKKDKSRLAEGMAITIEPGVYLEGEFGIRIEDTVVVTRQGCEILTPTSKQFLEI